MKYFLTVIIPNYNESANIKRGVLKDVSNYLEKQPYKYEVIISDDGSSDDSPAEIKQFISKNKNFRFLDNKHAGKPYALRSGINAAKGEYLLFTDMDQSTPISELDKLVPWVDKFSVVIGSRGTSRENSSFFRKYIVSLGFTTVRRLILLPRIKDTQCGFKLIKTSLAKKIFSQMKLFDRENDATGWKVTAYDVEMLYLARHYQKPIKEVEVIWRNEDISEGKDRNFVKESLEMLAEILRVRLNAITGKYN